MISGVLAFLTLWVLATLAFSRLAWFRRRPPLAARLAPHVDGGDPVKDIEDWLRQRADS